MKQAFIWSILLIFLMYSAASYAGVGRTGAQILDMGGGTRASGMGDAFAAVSGDVTAAFWNPSGLAPISEKQVMLLYSTRFDMFADAADDMHYGLMAFAMPVKDWGVFGTSLRIMDNGEVLGTGKSYDDITGNIDLGMDWVWALCYADEIKDNLLAGINGKIIRQTLGPESGTAYAVDMGVQYILPVVPLTIGIVLQNLGTEIYLIDESQSSPLSRKLKFGLAFMLMDTPDHRLQIVSDYTSFVDKFSKTDEDKRWEEENGKEMDVRKAGIGIHALRPENSQKGIGAEYWYSNVLGMRVGYRYIPEVDDDHYTVGFSIRYAGYQLDYARVTGVSDISPDGGNIDEFSILLRF